MLYSHHLASLETASQELQLANFQMFKSTQVCNFHWTLLAFSFAMNIRLDEN
jgi:hypothetical protein